MKKIISFILLIILAFPFSSRAETDIKPPSAIKLENGIETSILSWEDPDDPDFLKTILFRSSIPIEQYFSYQAVENLCDKIYEGAEEVFMDSGLAANLPYYYIFFSQNRSGDHSGAQIIKREPAVKEGKKQNIDTLADVPSDVANSVSLSEAGMVYNFNGRIEADENSRRLSLFIIVRSPHDLSEKDKNAISYFIHSGTPTTIMLGTGERAGVLNSYLSVFEKLPRNELEWQDVIKIGNGRWPEERNPESEKKASDDFFAAIYQRRPDMQNPNDNAAVTVIAYGLRPAKRNMESEKNAILIYRSIFKKVPVLASDWDIVRAIAYSGATR
jgi:hypothetical protein